MIPRIDTSNKDLAYDFLLPPVYIRHMEKQSHADEASDQENDPLMRDGILTLVSNDHDQPDLREKPSSSVDASAASVSEQIIARRNAVAAAWRDTMICYGRHYEEDDL